MKPEKKIRIEQLTGFIALTNVQGSNPVQD